VRKECRNYWTGILLEHFWHKAIWGIQFALLLFLHSLTSSILSFVTGLSFFVKRPLVEKYRSVIIVLFGLFVGTFWGKEIFVEKMQRWYYCAPWLFC
jgi:hypothetical protein